MGDPFIRHLIDTRVKLTSHVLEQLTHTVPALTRAEAIQCEPAININIFGKNSKILPQLETLCSATQTGEVMRLDIKNSVPLLFIILTRQLKRRL